MHIETKTSCPCFSEKLVELLEEGRRASESADSPSIRDDSRVKEILEAQGQLFDVVSGELAFQVGLAQVGDFVVLLTLSKCPIIVGFRPAFFAESSFSWANFSVFVGFVAHKNRWFEKPTRLCSYLGGVL